MRVRAAGLSRATGARLVMAMAALVALSACDVEWVADPPEPRSIVWVYAYDAQDRWVLGTRLRITNPGGSINAAIAYEQPFGTSGRAGMWTIVVTPPDGWVLAPDQPDVVRVDVPEDAEVDVTVRLAPEP